MHTVMKHWDPMIGCDLHLVILPPAPPAGPSPYFTFSFLSGMYVFFKPLWKQVTLYGASVEKGTDIGSLIPHIGAPSADLALTIAFSASKSYFGAAKYQVSGKTPALALALCVNPNLNCGTPCPTPTGAVIAINTHLSGMSWADVLGGLASMYADMVIQTILNVIGMGIGDKLSKLLDGGKLAFLGARLGPFIGNYGSNVISFLFGGPMGADVSFFGIIKDQKGDAWTPGGMVGTFVSEGAENIGRAVGDYLDGQPAHLPEVPELRKPASMNKPTVPNVSSNTPFDK